MALLLAELFLPGSATHRPLRVPGGDSRSSPPGVLCHAVLGKTLGAESVRRGPLLLRQGVLKLHT